ncbi:hypothetical protein Hdeb2414_s0011g00363471 [Helianthus debilis subsp. tardiflorus]
MLHMKLLDGLGIPSEEVLVNSEKTLNRPRLLLKQLPLSGSCKRSVQNLRKASTHQFENIQSLLPPNSWLGLHPVPDQRRDAARAENSLTLSFGSELISSQATANVAPSAVNVALLVSANGHPEESLNPVGEQKVDANGVLPSAEVQATMPEVKEAENGSSESQVKQG